MIEITTQRPEDSTAVERLLDAAFGAGRRAKTSYRYRDGVAPDPHLSLVARDGAGLAGSIRYWPVWVGAAPRPGLLLGPLAVAPARHGEGIGAALLAQSLDMAAWAGHRLVVLVGDPAYYGRFGFRAAGGHGIVMPDEDPARVLAAELVPGALADYAGPIRHWRWVRRSLTRAAA